MPPAVAQAPMVISVLHCRRTSWIRCGIVVGGNRSFHQSDVIRPLEHGTGGLGKIGDVNGSRYAQQFIFRVEQTQLTTVAGSKLEDCRSVACA